MALRAASIPVKVFRFDCSLRGMTGHRRGEKGPKLGRKDRARLSIILKPVTQAISITACRPFEPKADYNSFGGLKVSPDQSRPFRVAVPKFR